MFQEMELPYILGNENPEKSLYILRNGSPESLLYFLKRNFLRLKNKKNLLLKSFLYFRKWSFLIFQEFLKINLYILHDNILHQNYYKKILCLQ